MKSLTLLLGKVSSSTINQMAYEANEHDEKGVKTCNSGNHGSYHDLHASPGIRRKTCLGLPGVWEDWEYE